MDKLECTPLSLSEKDEITGGKKGIFTPTQCTKPQEEWRE